MTSMRKVETNRFVAEGESGRRYTVVEFTTAITTTPLSGRPQTMKGSREYVLVGGGHVNSIDADTYQIVETDEIIRKV